MDCGTSIIAKDTHKTKSQPSVSDNACTILNISLLAFYIVQTVTLIVMYVYVCGPSLIPMAKPCIAYSEPLLTLKLNFQIFVTPYMVAILIHINMREY